jgi:hypothetical protein
MHGCQLIADREIETNTTHDEREANTTGDRFSIHRPTELQFQGKVVKCIENRVVYGLRCVYCILWAMYIIKPWI